MKEARDTYNQIIFTAHDVNLIKMEKMTAKLKSFLLEERL